MESRKAGDANLIDPPVEPEESQNGSSLVSDASLATPAAGPHAVSEALPRSVLGVLLQRNFGAYFAGNLVSMCGTWFQNIAQALLIYRLTRSIFLVGVVNFAQYAAVFILGPWAGRAADRYDRRWLLAATQLSAAAVSGGLALLMFIDLVRVPVVMVAAFLLGITTALMAPVQMAIVPSLVATRDLSSAVALNVLIFNLARAIGPVIAAVVIANVGIAWAFAVNACSYLALVAAVAFIEPRPEVFERTAKPRLRDSFAVVARSPRLVMLFAVVAAASLTADPVITLTPAFAKEVFSRPDTDVGFLVAAFGAGAVAAAVFVTGTKASYARMSLSLAALGVGIAGFASAASFIQGMIALFVAGFGFLSAVTAATTVLHLETSPAHHGRVMALWSMAFLGIRPIGSLVDGGVTAVAGLRAGGLLMVLPAVAVIGGIARLTLRERRIGHDGARLG